MDPKSLKKSSRLRALILQSSTPVSLWNVKSLTSLRVLDFSYCTIELPSPIQKLRNLQILVLRRCTKLHPSITSLKMLIILDLGSCPLQYLSHGLEKLIYLQELSGFRVASQSNTQGCRLNALLGLKQLRVLQMSINNESEISEDEWNDGDISNFEISSESDQDSNGTTWVLEGLCLKFVPNLDLDWNVLLEDMPILRYAEVSRCFNLKNSPFPLDKSAVWKKNQD
ncbi:hypothetical protein WN943_025709 [Citrus x changshan-huyou]